MNYSTMTNNERPFIVKKIKFWLQNHANSHRVTRHFIGTICFLNSYCLKIILSRNTQFDFKNFKKTVESTGMLNSR